jgi:hypothetical protein
MPISVEPATSPNAAIRAAQPSNAANLREVEAAGITAH